MSVFHNNALIGGSNQNYQIERSLRFNSADSAYLNRTPASAGNRRKFTCSAWVKRTGILASLVDVPLLSAGDGTSFGISGTGALGATYDGRFYIRNGGANLCKIPNAVFRDPSAWYHFVFVVDTENAAAADRQILYVNGIRQENFDGSFTQNTDTNINTTTVHTIGVGLVTTANSSYSGNFLLAEYHFIDGQALTPSSFGETDTITGVWKPKKYAGTYGTNGFYLKFADNSGTTSTTLGKDSSGNGNNWTPNNFSVTAGAGNDSLIDTPTPYADGGNGRGNYCTLNPLKAHSGITLTNGNLNAVRASGSWVTSFATIGITSGKWYWEGTCTRSISDEALLGIAQAPATLSGYAGVDSYGWGYYTSATQSYKINNGSAVLYGATYTNGDVIGVALDLSAGTLTFYKNGTSQGTAYSSLSGEFFPTSSCVQGSAWVMNFGQRPFAYTPPSGFLALNTQNLPEPSIKKPSSYMDVKLYTGNSAVQSITGLNFSPDFVWIKGRSAAHNNALFDTIRGVRNVLISNSTAAEGAEPAGSSLTSFDASGFTLGANAPTFAAVNAGSTTYVAWCWDESATPGFDIVTYTGNGTNRTIAHSLGVAPKMIFVKPRGAVGDWIVYHESIANTNYVVLNLTNASAASSTVWNNTSPTSANFSLGTNTAVNTNTTTYVAYLWSEVAGFSKFGSYTGNGSADGPFVFTGMRPAYVMIKRTDAANNWAIHDKNRIGYNVANYHLLADSSSAEFTDIPIDFLSNGFKLRGTSGTENASGGTYVFAAFSESAFKYSLAR